MTCRLIGVFVIALCVVSGTVAFAKDYPRADLLLEPSELAKPEVAAKFLVLDARSVADYEKGHIPGARRVDHDVWKENVGNGKCLDWKERFSKLGISNGTDIVVYDDAMSKDAARIWWILRYWGNDHARLLNGGWAGWKAAKLPVSTEVPAPPKPTNFNLKPESERYVSKSKLLDLIKLGEPQIVDARSEKEFCGEAALGNKRPGAMPGAKHLEWSNLIDKKTQRFKPAEELRQLFAGGQIDLTQRTITHCQSGGRSSVMAFGLELMGAKRVGNYYNGWSEWGNADDTPIVVPEKTPAK